MSNTRIDRDDLEDKFATWSDGYWTDEDKKFAAIFDPFYSIPSRDEVSQFIQEAREALKSENKHNTDIWDCDQYSRYFLVHAAVYASKKAFPYKWPLGTISGLFKVGNGTEAHTCNWVYMMGDRIALIEPQTGDFKDINYAIERSLRLILV